MFSEADLKLYGGLILGSALGASFAAGVPFMDVVQSMQGSAGMAVGYLAGQLAAGTDEKSYYPLIGGIGVPLVLGGAIDNGFIGLAAGGAAGIYLAGYNFESKKK